MYHGPNYDELMANVCWQALTGRPSAGACAPTHPAALLSPNELMVHHLPASCDCSNEWKCTAFM